jgi:aspartate racemase
LYTGTVKTIGLIGGMSWESTTTYYRKINEGVKARLGGLHSADILLRSIDFEPMEELQRREDWDAAASFLTDIAQGLERGGADFLLICTNTMHKVAPQVQERIGIPLLHIADAAGARLEKSHIRTAGLLGTKFTMEQDFYRRRIEDGYGIEVTVPGKKDQEEIHRIIYDELCTGRFDPESRNFYLGVIQDLSSRGAEGVILGCTEIPLLVGQPDTRVRLFDTAEIHASTAVEMALS